MGNSALLIVPSSPLILECAPPLVCATVLGYNTRREGRRLMRDKLILALAVLVALLSWWVIYELTGRVRPDLPGALYLFFFLLFVAFTATLVPITAYLNRRFAPKALSLAPLRFLRHSFFGGVCLTFWAWLQMHRAFNLGFAFIIALIFVAIEFFVVRTRGEV
jgi:hypothetical protein